MDLAAVLLLHSDLEVAGFIPVRECGLPLPCHLETGGLPAGEVGRLPDLGMDISTTILAAVVLPQCRLEMAGFIPVRE